MNQTRRAARTINQSRAALCACMFPAQASLRAKNVTFPSIPPPLPHVEKIKLTVTRWKSRNRSAVPEPSDA